MAEYIEREAVCNDCANRTICVDKSKCTVGRAHAADVVEVVHGEWIEHEWAEEENGLLISNFECSVCHNWERKKSDYCPNCGAKMDGGKANE